MTATAIRLTPRERQILALLADGLSTAEMGARLGTSPWTVRTQVQSLLLKFGVQNRHGAVGAGFRYGFLAVEGPTS
jgi:two-component system nitrate/nitrite response regulator NarL